MLLKTFFHHGLLNASWLREPRDNKNKTVSLLHGTVVPEHECLAFWRM